MGMQRHVFTGCESNSENGSEPVRTNQMNTCINLGQNIKTKFNDCRPSKLLRDWLSPAWWFPAQIDAHKSSRIWLPVKWNHCGSYNFQYRSNFVPGVPPKTSASAFIFHISYLQAVSYRTVQLLAVTSHRRYASENENMDTGTKPIQLVAIKWTNMLEAGYYLEMRTVQPAAYKCLRLVC